MIISNGSTELTFSGTQMDDFIDIEQSSVNTAGGQSRTVRSGGRFINQESVRMTGAEYRTLFDLLMDGSENYYYTPTITPDTMDDSDFPMSVKIETPVKQGQSGGGSKKYYIEFKFTGTSYI